MSMVTFSSYKLSFIIITLAASVHVSLLKIKKVLSSNGTSILFNGWLQPGSGMLLSRFILCRHSWVLVQA